MTTNSWAVIEDTDPLTRRMRVPGGWLYQVENITREEPIAAEPGAFFCGWHPPVFVPFVPEGPFVKEVEP